MIFFERLVWRWKIRPLVKRMPSLLKDRYGAGKFYTSGQVRATLEFMKLKPQLLPSAYALACTAPDYLMANPTATEDDYVRLRGEIARWLKIPDRELNCEALTHKFRPPLEVPASSDMTPPSPGL